MPKHRLAFLAPVLALTMGALACSSARSALPPGARVEVLQTQRLVLRGTAAPHPESASCASSTTGAATRFVQLNEDAAANVVLRPTGGVALLHVQELATNQTWCVMTHGDGTGATIPGEFSSGIYAITVEGSHSDVPTSYSVVIEKL